jgi:hypothetical protein
MVGSIVSLSPKHRQVSQQDIDIMMTCVDYHDTFLPLHHMIPTTFTLPHLIFSIAPSSSSHFTSCLPHQPWVILQSSVHTQGAYPSHKQLLCVPCPSCGYLYVIGASLTWHWTSCITHSQSSAFGVLMPSTLLFSPPLAWTWITSLYMIDVFHLGLPCLHSYHHIPNVFHVKVQHVLPILLAWLDVDPSDIVAWHEFLLFHSCVVISATWRWKKPPRILCLFVLIHGKGVGNITRGAYN